jgi:alpha 1,3-glucosidase
MEVPENLLEFWLHIYFRYTLFYEHTLTGLPVMRPLWLEFPEEESGFDEEREYLIG